ncbi:NADPH-dependent FMN reductase [Streptomyces sp. NPDC057554]|uniref:NADPH-dependent FMN reductase n=1 Tax=Streptomyces sp. NPDC057554 TaxID=3350538 RepID=UPI0036997D9E
MSLTAPLRNAINLLSYQEWQGKPVVLLSCTAGPSGGVPAIKALRPFLARIGFRPVERSISVPGFAELTGLGGFRAPAGLAAELADVLDEMAKLLADADGRARAQSLAAGSTT